MYTELWVPRTGCRYFFVVILYLRNFVVSQDTNKVTGDAALLSVEEKKQIFIADEIYSGIVPVVNDCWKEVLAAYRSGEFKNPSIEQKSLWNDIFTKKLKPYHLQMRNMDAVIFDNKPSDTLNPVVNINNVEEALNLSNQVKHNSAIDWIELVKDGWIKVSGMIDQLHYKYNRVFDNLFVEGLTEYTDEDLGFMFNVDFRQHYNWYNNDEKDQFREPDPLGTAELSENSKKAITGNDTLDQNLFEGLRVLLKLRTRQIQQAGGNWTNKSITVAPCCSRSTDVYGGVRGMIFKYIPIYVLLHLLNAEFKLYIMQNFATMYSCVHRQQKCDSEAMKASEEHLKSFYRFYFDGISDVFQEKANTKEMPSSTPSQAWRWRCDPPVSNDTTLRQHKEDVTYTRFYDYQTFFVAEEVELSLTQTCRDSCDMYDGAYSSIPCEKDDWACLGQDKEFDCLDRIRRGLTCPSRARKLCPNEGIKCTSGRMETALICDGQTDKRYVEWFNFNGIQMGKPTTCDPATLHTLSSQVILERSGITKNDVQICDLCVCKCAEPIGNDTHRYISLLPQIANINEHRTLVGVKFIKIDKVIYIKIAEAEVRDGVPDTSTVRWVEPTLVSNLSDPTQVFRLGRHAKNILLDDFLVPSGSAITGLQFQAIGVPSKGDYDLDIAMNEQVGGDVNRTLSWVFNYEEMELGLRIYQTEIRKFSQPGISTNLSQWRDNFENTSWVRTKINIDDPDEPTGSLETSLPNSAPNQYISVQPSSIKKDAGQTPVPFFDTQDVIEPINISFVRGLGIFYKSSPGYGGFLALRIISVPITDKVPPSNYNLWQTLSLPKST